jgi:deazaflavin-dependent oxidoreductase (nitroreductase family)
MADFTHVGRVAIRSGDTRSPDEWLRAVFEGAPAPVRWFLVTGWRTVLGLRLGPRPSPDHVLGQRRTAPGTLTMRTRALHTELTLAIADGTVSLTCAVDYLRPSGRLRWAIAAPAHRLLTPVLLRRAASAGRPRATVLRMQRHVVNPVARRVARFLPGQAVVETIGRRSGQPRRTPVGGRRDGDSFWLVSEFGRQSQYIRNIEANPRVRVRLGGRWHAGTAVLLDEDDPRARLRRLPPLNGLVVRIVGVDLLTVRIDLDTVPQL